MTARAPYIVGIVMKQRFNNKDYQNLFYAGDVNGDGVLDYNEFQGIIKVRRQPCCRMRAAME